MCCILTGEIIYNRDIWVPGHRLSWPYGDFVPGNYLTKVGLPVVVIASAVAVAKGGQNALIAGLFMVLGILFVTLMRVSQEHVKIGTFSDIIPILL